MSEMLAQQVREIMQACECYQDTIEQTLEAPDILRLIDKEVKKFVKENPEWSEQAVREILLGINELNVTVKRVYPWGFWGPEVTQVKYWKLRRK